MQVSFSFYYATRMNLFLTLLMSCVKYLQCLFLAVVFHFISVQLKLSFWVLAHVTNIVRSVEDKSDTSFSVINSCKGLSAYLKSMNWTKMMFACEIPTVKIKLYSRELQQKPRQTRMVLLWLEQYRVQQRVNNALNESKMWIFSEYE